MRSRASSCVIIVAVLAAVALPLNSHARLFWQTYGATVASPADCAWNVNSDYFVPRHCDSCRYDLFSPCKAAHTMSPACKYLHPIYAGYCTPYGPGHYKWRDHVYKEYCGCTPLKCVHGPWRLEKCRKHHCVSHGGEEVSSNCGSLCARSSGGCSGDCGFVANGEAALALELPNVEPFGGQTLGTIAAFPAGMMGGRSPTASMPGAPAGQTMAAPPTATSAAGGGTFSLPALFGQ